MKAGGREDPEDGREGPSRLGNSQPPSESGSSPIAVLEASFARQIRPLGRARHLHISVLPLNTLGSGLNCHVLMFTVRPTLSSNSSEGPRSLWPCPPRQRLCVGNGSTWQPRCDPEPSPALSEWEPGGRAARQRGRTEASFLFFSFLNLSAVFRLGG